MADAPRTWTLRSTSIDGSDFETLDGPRVGKPACIVVVEKAPVDAERERMLDLLDAAYWKLGNEALCKRIGALLRDHGRLPKEER